jgi:hypothetical protein
VVILKSELLKGAWRLLTGRRNRVYDKNGAWHHFQEVPMRKLCITAALLAACAVSLAAQEVPGASVSTLLNVGNYSKLFLNAGGILARKYDEATTDEDYERIATLAGNTSSVDTPLEIALLSTSTGVINIRPVEAVEMIGSVREADLKLGAAAYMDMQAAKFLGSDPAPYAAALKFITDRSRVTEADINNFMVQGISTEVDKQFKNTLLSPNEIKAIKDILTIFFVRPNTTTFNAVRDVSFIYNVTSMALSGEKKKAYNDVKEAYDNTLRSLCFGLLGAIEKDIWGNFDFKSGADNVITLASMVQAVEK